MPAGIAFSRDGATAYVAFSRNNSLALIDTETRKVKKEIPVGIAPFAVALSSQGKLYVSSKEAAGLLRAIRQRPAAVQRW